MIQRARIAGRINDNQMIVIGIICVPLQALPVIDQIAIAAQFLNKDAVAQTLGPQQILLGRGKPDVKLRFSKDSHRVVGFWSMLKLGYPPKWPKATADTRPKPSFALTWN